MKREGKQPLVSREDGTGGRKEWFYDRGAQNFVRGSKSLDDKTYLGPFVYPQKTIGVERALIP